MSQSFVDQITLDYLINKETMGKHLMKQREKQIEKVDLEYYKNRIIHIFTEIINNTYQDEISPDVKYAHNTFVTRRI